MTAVENRKWKFSFRVTVVGMFVIMTMLTAAVAISLQYYFSTRLATQSALDHYRQTAARTSDYLASIDSQAISATRLLSTHTGLVHNGRVSARSRNLLAATLQRNPLFYAAYIGFPNGDIYDLINLDSGSTVRQQLRALPQDRWVAFTVSGKQGKRLRRYFYYDEHFKLRASRSEASEYMANSRAWFVHAQIGKVYKTAPYLFQHLQAPGETYSTRLPGKNAVLAVDITLAALSEKLSHQSISRNSNIYLYQADGKIIASTENPSLSLELPRAQPLALTPEQEKLVADNPVLTVSNETDWAPFDFTASGKPYGYSIDMLSLISQMTGLKFRYVNGYTWPEFLTMFHQGRLDILQPVLRTGENSPLGDMSKPFLDVPFGVLTRSDAAPVTDITQLNGKRVAIPAGWSIIDTLRSNFPAIHIVETKGVQGMFDAVRAGKVDAGIDTAALLRYTAREFFYDDVTVNAPLDFGRIDVPTGLHYSVNSSHRGVADLINLALTHVTEAQREALKTRWLMNHSDSLQQRAVVPYAKLITLTTQPDSMNHLQKVDLGGVSHFVFLQAIGKENGEKNYFAAITPTAVALAPAIAEVKTALLVTGGILILLLPLASGLASFIVDPVRQLAVENQKVQQRHYRELVPIDSRIVEIDDLASSLTVMAHSIEKHAKEQEALMDSFIQLIAQAIDDKSPYTAGHCARVPELAMMLAQKAEASNDPPFDRFHFDGEQEWREFRIGAWLHDCGKITTPDHIVDKGTKLETAYDRIHEIRMRFEVLWRDAEISYLKQLRDSPQTEPELCKALERQHQKLQEDFAFIAACNVGGEFMSQEDVARLEHLAETTWQRHFDDRLGLSHIEQARFQGQPEELPVTEKLLADKPWHIIERIHSADYDPRLGIRMDVPEHLYNRGELHNLKIARGTLTAEDRFKINEHMISTIRMLDKLPLPKELERVPRYASTHHETLDGRGYPRKLTAEDLSIPERIMVLADIFEALTAADRPYKAAKPVSVAIDILYKMVQNNHVDRDVFELFLRSGIYLEYARRYLPEAQIDEVDIERYLG